MQLSEHREQKKSSVHRIRCKDPEAVKGDASGMLRSTGPARFATGSRLPQYIATKTAVSNHRYLFRNILDINTSYERTRMALVHVWSKESRIEYFPLLVTCDDELYSISGHRTLNEFQLRQLLRNNLVPIKAEATSTGFIYSEKEFPLL